MKIASIVGARPQFIKLAPLALAVEEHGKAHRSSPIDHLIIHTGQHYDYQMNKVFFDELGIPQPHYSLGVGSGPHGRQTADMIKRIEPILLKEKPAWTLVYGDTNSTLAGAIAAVKIGAPLAHIEAGLRSFNRTMPEEINRVLTDHCADVLFCPTKNAANNLKKEGFANIVNQGNLIKPKIPPASLKSLRPPIVVNVGDIMVDALLMAAGIAEQKSRILDELGLKPKRYYLATLHRAENTDDPKVLASLVETFRHIHKHDKPLVFSLHPRTKKALKKNHLARRFAGSSIIIDPPLSYFDMLIMEKYADKILTDSGGIQKEAYFFGVPCITLRHETEWIETEQAKSNIIAGTKRKDILKALDEARVNPAKFRKPVYGDGTSRTLILHFLDAFRLKWTRE